VCALIYNGVDGGVMGCNGVNESVFFKFKGNQPCTVKNLKPKRQNQWTILKIQFENNFAI
jgi:hypothetical protein